MSRGRMLGAGLGLLALGGAVGYAVGARSAGTGAGEPAATGPVVASFAGGEVRADEVQARIRDEGPLMAQTYGTAEGRRQLVERMVRERVLTAEARRKGYHLRPAVQRQCEGALLETFLEEEFEAPERKRPVTDTELEAFFAAQQQSLSRPAQARVAQILLAAPEGDAAQRERQRRAATALLAEAKAALARDADAFASLARRRSEDPRTRPLGGELPMMAEEQLTRALGEQVAKAVFDASAPRGLLGQVLESRDGFRVVMVLERTEAVTPALEDVRELLRPRVARERRTKAYEAFVSGLEQQAQVEIEQDALAALAPAPAAQAADTK